MALYTVHLPGNRRDASALEKAVLLREGFCWSAFVFSALWLLWQRLWLALLGFVVVSVALAVLANIFGLPEWASMLLELLPALALGFEGRNLVRAKLERKGFFLAGVVSADTAEKAEGLAFERLRDEATPDTRRTASSYVPRHPSGDDVIGLFPQPGSAR